jgi:hypothetical protein
LRTNHPNFKPDFLGSHLSDNARLSSSGARNGKWKAALRLALYSVIPLVDMVMCIIVGRLKTHTDIETGGEEIMQIGDRGMRIITETVARSNGDWAHQE